MVLGCQKTYRSADFALGGIFYDGVHNICRFLESCYYEIDKISRQDANMSNFDNESLFCLPTGIKFWMYGIYVNMTSHKSRTDDNLKLYPCYWFWRNVKVRSYGIYVRITSLPRIALFLRTTRLINLICFPMFFCYSSGFHSII